MSTQSGLNTTPEQTQQRVISNRAVNKGRKAVEKNYNTLEKLAVTYLPADKIQPNDWNPNRQSDHDFELLMKSMEEDGFTQPIIVLREPTNGCHMVVDGEHRWRAGIALGLKELPVVMVDMTPEQARISTIRHNRARGSHDIELEANLLRDLQKLGALDWAADSLMMSDIEVNKLLTDLAAPEALASEEFTEAWIPDNFTEKEADLIRHGDPNVKASVTQNADGSTSMYAMSAQAIEKQRERERLIAAAKTEQERQTVKREVQIYRVSVMFSGEEGQIVKQALGDNPAEKLLELCKAHLNVV